MASLDKIFVDSRHCVDGANTSQFRVELGETFNTGPMTTFAVDNINMPHTWYTLESDERLYIIEKDSSNTITPRIITITQGHYDSYVFATTLQTALNAQGGLTYTVAYEPSTGKITISVNNGSIIVPTDKQLKDTIFYAFTWISEGGPTYSYTNPRTINHVLNNAEIKTYSTSFESGRVDMNAIHSVMLHCPQLGGGVMDARGIRTNIIRRVGIDVPWGHVQSSPATHFDSLPCPSLTCRNLDFELRRPSGELLNIQGAHVSFSLTFSN